MKFIERYIRLTYSNIESANILYKEQQYPQCIFYLQQSTEMLNKAIAIYSGVASYEELKKVKHNSLKLFRLVLKKQKDKLEKIVKYSKENKTEHNTVFVKKYNPSNYLENTIEAISGFDQIINYLKTNTVTKKDIEEIISTLNQIENTDFPSFEISNDIMLKSLETSFYWIYNIAGYNKKEIRNKISQISQEDIDLMKKAVDSILNTILIFNKSFMISFSIGAIVLLSAESARYIMIQENKKIIDPIELYNENNLLIKNFEKLVKYLKKATDYFVQFIQKIDDLNNSVS